MNTDSLYGVLSINHNNNDIQLNAIKQSLSVATLYFFKSIILFFENRPNYTFFILLYFFLYFFFAPVLLYTFFFQIRRF